MNKDIFISYSRRDQEFVARLAADLDQQVAGVWFDQSAIQVGHNWHNEIMDGIRECKAFILVLSPDAAESRYVREEVTKALELGKPIIPVLYRPGEWTGEFASLVHDIQTLDLRSGSYGHTFQQLVDGLIAVGVAKVEGYEKPFMREGAKVGLDVVFQKIPGWAFAWGAGWAAFWMIVSALLFVLLVAQDESGAGEALTVLFVIVFSGGFGGFVGGLLAGLFTMLALRPNAPSISWKHMAPTIRVWALSGPLGMLVSGIATAIMVTVGAISVQSADVSCDGLNFGECLGAGIGSAIGEAIALAILIVFVFFLLVGVIWFLTGVFAGRQVVRHIRRLEPGITARQSRRVSLGWGCGTLVATIITIMIIGLISNAMGL